MHERKKMEPMLACRRAIRKSPSCSFYHIMLKSAKKRQKALDTPYTWINKSNVEGILILYQNLPQIKKELVLACRLAVKKHIMLKNAFEKAYS